MKSSSDKLLVAPWAAPAQLCVAIFIVAVLYNN
jgi:hypothetical protein